MSFDIIVAIVGPLTSPSLMAKDEAGGGAAVRECECDAVVWHGVCAGGTRMRCNATAADSRD